MKSFVFVNDAARQELRNLPVDVRMAFGVDLQAVQRNEKPALPIVSLASSVGKGAFEIKYNGSPAFRVVYCAKFENRLFILHAFSKTTNGVDRKAMQVAKSRYKMMLEILAKE